MPTLEFTILTFHMVVIIMRANLFPFSEVSFCPRLCSRLLFFHRPKVWEEGTQGWARITLRILIYILTLFESKNRISPK